MARRTDMQRIASASQAGRFVSFFFVAQNTGGGGELWGKVGKVAVWCWLDTTCTFETLGDLVHF